MNELEKVGFATFVNNGDGWERVPNAKFMMKDEDGTEIEMTPNEVIKQLMQDNKLLEHYINNLQSKIDKAIEYINNLRDESAERQEFYDCYPDDLYIPNIDELLDILKENKHGFMDKKPR